MVLPFQSGWFLASLYGPSETGAPGGSLRVRIMRVSTSGGSPELVLSARGTTDVQCTRAPATLCVYNEQDQNQMVFFAFDPLRGKGRELARLRVIPQSTEPGVFRPTARAWLYRELIRGREHQIV